AWEPGYAWQGWHEPPRAGLTDGVAVMANQRGPSAPLGVEFAPPHRADRITALLAGRRQWSADGMPAIHMDTHLASAAPVLDLLATLPGDGDGDGDGDGPGEPLSAPAAALRDRLLRWDRRMDADSADAAAFAAVRRGARAARRGPRRAPRGRAGRPGGPAGGGSPRGPPRRRPPAPRDRRRPRPRRSTPRGSRWAGRAGRASRRRSAGIPMSLRQ